MITLTDVRNDLRIRKEAVSVANRHSVCVVSNIESIATRRFELHGLWVTNVRLRLRWLPKSPIFWVMKYFEFFCRSTLAAIRERAVIYHGHEISGALPAWLASRWTRAKFIYDAHELEADREGLVQRSWWLNRILLAVLRFLMRRADHVICANESRAKIMLAEYGVREMPTAILNVTPRCGIPVNVPGADLRAKFGLEGNRIIIYQGTLSRSRGLDRAVAALRCLADDVVLWVLGSGDREPLLAQAKQDGTLSRLIFVGHLPADELGSYMKTADVGLAIYQNNCRNNYHCAPNKVFEYASVGLPVVGPNFPEVESVILQHGIGKVFDPASPTEIARAVREVMDDEQQHKAMSRRALSLKETVNWEQEERKLLAVYEEQLACCRPGSSASASRPADESR